MLDQHPTQAIAFQTAAALMNLIGKTKIDQETDQHQILAMAFQTAAGFDLAKKSNSPLIFLFSRFIQLNIHKLCFILKKNLRWGHWNLKKTNGDITRLANPPFFLSKQMTDCSGCLREHKQVTCSAYMCVIS
jgi:hypothetical protein